MQTHRFDFTPPTDPKQTEYRLEVQMDIPADDDKIRVRVTRCVELETGLDVHFGDLDPEEQESAREYAALLWNHERLPRFFPEEMEQARAYYRECAISANDADYQLEEAESRKRAAEQRLKAAKSELEIWKKLWTVKA